MITDARAAATGPGRTRGGGYWLQRGRLAPQHRHFGEVTSRTRRSRPYASKASPFPWSLPAPSDTAGPGKDPLDTEGSQFRQMPGGWQLKPWAWTVFRGV